MSSNKPQPLDLEQVRKEVFKWIVGQPANELEEFFDFTMEEVEQRIKKACEFFLKFKDNPNKFMWETPIPELEKYLGIKLSPDDYTDFDWTCYWKSVEDYNEWLFKLAFKGVF